MKIAELFLQSIVAKSLVAQLASPGDLKRDFQRSNPPSPIITIEFILSYW